MVSLLVPNPPPAARLVLRVLTAAGAGFVSFGLMGTISIGGERLGFTIKATGSMAIFVLVYLVDPPSKLASKLRSKTPR